MTTIKGSRALITGGASGLGLSLAKALVARGAEVVLWDIDQGGLDAAVEGIRNEGGRAEGKVIDITDRQAVYAAADELLARSGPVDILVNNAGIVTGRTLLESPDAMIEKTMAVNALAHFWTLKGFLPAMLEQDRGHVVTVASAAGLLGVNRLADYCASKHAAVGLDESLRIELARAGSKVHTTVVCPYFINTHMFDGVKTRYSFLLPLLKQEDVIARIVKAIERDRTRVIMPPLVRWSFLLRFMPTGLFDWVMTQLGVHNTMDGFEHAPPADATVRGHAPATSRQPAHGNVDGSHRSPAA